MKYLNKRRWYYSCLRFCCLLNIVIVLLSSCSDSEKNGVSVMGQYSDSIPEEVFHNVEMKYSEQGRIIFVIIGNDVESYLNQDKLVFENGMKVNFFERDLSVKTSLTADYGINVESKKIVEVRGNVILTNHQSGETLYTQHLRWEQNKKMIFSDTPVKIVTPDQTIYGAGGMEADETFDHWTILQPSGNFKIDENE